MQLQYLQLITDNTNAADLSNGVFAIIKVSLNSALAGFEFLNPARSCSGRFEIVKHGATLLTSLLNASAEHQCHLLNTIKSYQG